MSPSCALSWASQLTQKLANHLCDRKIVLTFENRYQAGFDAVICTRRAADNKPHFQLLVITCNAGKGCSFVADAVRLTGETKGQSEPGGMLLDRLTFQAEKMRTLRKAFAEVMGVGEDQLTHVHVMLCELSGWNNETFDAKLKGCGAVNTLVLDRAAALRGLGPICGTVLDESLGRVVSKENA